MVPRVLSDIAPLLEPLPDPLPLPEPEPEPEPEPPEPEEELVVELGKKGTSKQRVLCCIGVKWNSLGEDGDIFDLEERIVVVGGDRDEVSAQPGAGLREDVHGEVTANIDFLE